MVLDRGGREKEGEGEGKRESGKDGEVRARCKRLLVVFRLIRWLTRQHMYVNMNEWIGCKNESHNSLLVNFSLHKWISNIRD